MEESLDTLCQLRQTGESALEDSLDTLCQLRQKGESALEESLDTLCQLRQTGDSCAKHRVYHMKSHQAQSVSHEITPSTECIT